MPNNTEDLRVIFTDIYKNKEWGVSRSGNLSGTGDIIGNLPFFLFFENFLAQQSISSMIDFGCGDWSLMKYINFPINMKYTGVDLVDSVVKKNNDEFRQDNITFHNFTDIYTNQINNENNSEKLLLIKNVFENWDIQDVQSFLDKMIGKFKYSIIACFYNPKGYNLEVPAGWFHTLNMLDFKYPTNKKIEFLFAHELYDNTYNAYYLCSNSEASDIKLDGIILPIKNMSNVILCPNLLDSMIFENTKYANYAVELNDIRKKYGIQKFMWANNNEIFIDKNQMPLAIMIGGFEYASTIHFENFFCNPIINKIKDGLFKVEFTGADNAIYLYSFHEDIEKLFPYLLKSGLMQVN
jgi:hypothetical protein